MTLKPSCLLYLKLRFNERRKRRLELLPESTDDLDNNVPKIDKKISHLRELIKTQSAASSDCTHPTDSGEKVEQTNNLESIDSIEDLLNFRSIKERECDIAQNEISELLKSSTAKERFLYERFRIDRNIYEFCEHGTVEECVASNESRKRCHKVHFRKLIHPHTDVSLGDCSFLNTCFHMDTCKYIHYEIDRSDFQADSKENELPLIAQIATKILPPQWVQCDLRTFDITVLGKFSIVMADPPWDIHMELPYGTMADGEMRKLNIPCLQDEGYIFLWVTGRAMELGRECLQIWGYKRCDELVWVKTNQLQRIIRTGRTGHWLNHGKEHCLVGVKGDISKGKFNRGLDCDVIVSEVRATSRKPDEIYGICERLSPGTRKVELFGRPHNVQPNWITLGNQLEGIRLVEPDVAQRFRERYPKEQV